jgi:hypothetical protein
MSGQQLLALEAEFKQYYPDHSLDLLGLYCQYKEDHPSAPPEFFDDWLEFVDQQAMQAEADRLLKDNDYAKRTIDSFLEHWQG